MSKENLPDLPPLEEVMESLGDSPNSTSKKARGNSKPSLLVEHCPIKVRGSKTDEIFITPTGIVCEHIREGWTTEHPPDFTGYENICELISRIRSPGSGGLYDIPGNRCPYYETHIKGRNLT